MQDLLQQLQHWIQSLQDAILPSLYWLRARVGIQTVTLAVMSAGGMLVLLLGLFSTKRVNLLGEAAHLEGVREPGALDRLQTRLYQSGIRIKVYEFLAVGIMLGALLGAIFILLGFVSIGIAFGLSGPFVYYQFLMNRRVKEMRQFREELPIAILDTRDHLIMRANDLRGAMLEMAERGPSSLRVDFEYAFRSMRGGADSEPLALREVSRKREEPFFRQFFDALANHHKGGDTAAVLTRVAQGQKTHNRLQAKTRAKQSGLRLVGIIYLCAPPFFAVFMALSGGPEAVAFYASLEGQMVQLLAVLAGVMSYWLSSKIAMRGLYMDEVTRVRLDTEQVSAYVTTDEFGGSLASDEPFFVGADAVAVNGANNNGGSNQAGQLAAVDAAGASASASINGNGRGHSAQAASSRKALDDEFDLEPEGDDAEDLDADVPIGNLLAFQDLDIDALFGSTTSDTGASNAGASNAGAIGTTHSYGSSSLAPNTNTVGGADTLPFSFHEPDDELDDDGAPNHAEATQPQDAAEGNPSQVSGADAEALTEGSRWARPVQSSTPPTPPALSTARPVEPISQDPSENLGSSESDSKADLSPDPADPLTRPPSAQPPQDSDEADKVNRPLYGRKPSGSARRGPSNGGPTS